MNLIVHLSLDKTKISKVIVYSRFSTVNKVMIKLMLRISFRSELLVNCLKFRDKFNFIFVILIY